MIKVELGILTDSIAPIQELMAKELKAKTAYKIAKSIQAMNIELEAYQSAVTPIREKYLLPQDEWGNETTPEFKDTDGASKFNDELVELRATEIELPINRISVNDISSISISTVAMMQLLWLFED